MPKIILAYCGSNAKKTIKGNKLVKKCNTNDCNKRGLEEDWNNKLQKQKMQYK